MVISVMTFLFVVGFLAIAQEEKTTAPAPAAAAPAPEKAKEPPAAEKAKEPPAAAKEADKLKIGDAAPAINLKDQDGKDVSLTNFAGKKVLVYFYPKADSPVCTKQACALRDANDELTKLGVNVIGISPDAQDAQKKFAEKNKLTFPLLSDTDHKVADSYGVWSEKVVKGKTTSGINRASFLIGEDGKIAKTWYRVPADKTAKLAIDFLSKTKETKQTKEPAKTHKAHKETKEPAKTDKEPDTSKQDK